jgi:hypothetical protein
MEDRRSPAEGRAPWRAAPNRAMVSVAADAW